MLPLITKLRKQALSKLKKAKTIGYFCLYVPPELIEAAGFVPIRLAGLGDGLAENAGEKFIHNEACSFCKECLGLRNSKHPPYDNLDYLIIPSGCDQMKRHGEIWQQYPGKPELLTYQLFVPATWEDPSSQEIYWQELKWLASELNVLNKRKQGRINPTTTDVCSGAIHRTKLTLLDAHKPDELGLKTIVNQYNDARKRMQRLNNLLSYEDSFNLAHLFFISPVSDFLKYLDEIESVLKPRSSTAIRLLILGSPIGYGDNFVQTALAKYPQTDIVYDATCTGQRAFELDISTSGNILANIATAYFTRPPCIWRRPNSQFYQYIKEIINRYQINGIIYKTLKFCDLWNYEFKRFKDWAPCPVIHIENTYSLAQSAQINKRIAVFMEVLKNHPSPLTGEGRVRVNNEY
jgi:benzoyl-CoA reductase/2-hydroxyglutaryl-CoA dehydratase subunit BcrC/BadD/HgdB